MCVCVFFNDFVCCVLYVVRFYVLDVSIFRVCDLFDVSASFSKFPTCSDLFGPIGTRWDASGCIRMHPEAFGRRNKNDLFSISF